VKYMEKREKNRLLIAIKEHIRNNLKQYLIVGTLFIIGIIIGTAIANNYQEPANVASNKILNAIKKINEGYEIDYSGLLKNEIYRQILYALLLWFLGCSVIGIPIVYILISFKGLSLGYTIATVILALGTPKGTIFVITTLLLQNLLIIPATLAIAVSGMNLYSSITKNKKMENIKVEIIRHTVFCSIMLIILILGVFIETYVSYFLLKNLAKFFV